MVGAIASGVNSVAGGGSLLSFPTLVEMGLPSKVANATNSVALWPGSLGGALGYRNVLDRTKHHLKTLFLPTLLGSGLGAYLLERSETRLFDRVVPILILLAAILLLFQPTVKKFVLSKHDRIPTWAGVGLQFVVSVYGGYFGAGMGIMMLAAFALYIEGNLHELNAVKNWLGMLINVAASALFIARGLVEPVPGIALGAGAIVGGFASAKLSQKLNPDRLRLVISIYGVGMAVYYLIKYWK